jgi:LytS/YehU family sensor histidine kinase
LTVSINLDPNLRHHPVPAFALQTLVENAIKHGLERSRERCVLTVSTTARPNDSQEQPDLLVSIQDTGIGIPQLFGRETPAVERMDFFGIGLSNVHERLLQLYGRTDLLGFESGPDTGTHVTLTLPPAPSPH